MMSRDAFVEGIIARAKVLREAGVLGKRSAPVNQHKIERRGRPPKPKDLGATANLIDAFDEIEEPLEQEEPAD